MQHFKDPKRRTKFNLPLQKSVLDESRKHGWDERSSAGKKLGFKRDEQGILYRMVGCRDVWDDIPFIHPRANERIGYNTQKPEALLERIILASSDEGDVVGDFFCGGGTTPAVAQRLNRRFIACDSSRAAIKLTKERVKGNGR